MDDQDNQVIYTFPRGKGEEIQISIRHLNQRSYIDLRQWYQAKHEAIFLPTTKGIRLPAEAISDLQKGISRLAEALKRTSKSTEEPT